MGPSRTDVSSSKRPSKHRKNGTVTSSTAEKAPGVSKLKAQLRQTRRLLSKVSYNLTRVFTLPVPTFQDDLAADVRVETERRLKSLQKDLEGAKIANKEKALAVRYHKVKFFGQLAPPIPPHTTILTGPLKQNGGSWFGKSIKSRNKRRSTKTGCSPFESI